MNRIGFIAGLFKVSLFFEQESIRVGCVPSAAVAAGGGGVFTGVSARGVSIYTGGVYTGGCLCRGDVCPGGADWGRGLSAQGESAREVSAWGGCLPDTPSIVNRMTDRQV